MTHNSPVVMTRNEIATLTRGDGQWVRRTLDHFSRRDSVVAASGKIVWVGRVISALVFLVFMMSGFMKVKGGAEVTQGMAHLGLPESLRMPLALLEISCAVIYLIPATAVVGAILLTGFIGGAICTHWRVADPVFIQIALGLLVWLGLYLREDRLKALIPVRRL
jgi:hypothetical protein